MLVLALVMGGLAGVFAVVAPGLRRPGSREPRMSSGPTSTPSRVRSGLVLEARRRSALIDNIRQSPEHSAETLRRWLDEPAGSASMGAAGTDSSKKGVGHCE